MNLGIIHGEQPEEPYSFADEEILENLAGADYKIFIKAEFTKVIDMVNNWSRIGTEDNYTWLDKNGEQQATFVAKNYLMPADFYFFRINRSIIGKKAEILSRLGA